MGDQSNIRRARPQPGAGALAWPQARASIVVPAFNAGPLLDLSIAAIRATAPPGSQIIVVDDGSLDDTLERARRLADVVIARPCQAGAARARNDALFVADGDVLVFVDSDVVVSVGAIPGLLQHIRAGADAAFGAYEALPPPSVRNAATDYKNLLHHFTHLQATGEAQTFWSGFGAITREAFMAVGGFDPAVTTSADVEDIHLGYRLRASGYRIVLDPTLQVQHHKRYGIRSMVMSDLVHRAIPWTRAMIELRTFSADLNLRRHAIISTAAACATLAGAVAAPFSTAGLVAAGAAAGAWTSLERDFLRYVRRWTGWRGAASAAGFLFAYHVYSPAGAVAGALSFLIRGRNHSVQNSFKVAEQLSTGPTDVDVTVAIICAPGEPVRALEALGPVERWWELLVVGADVDFDVPTGATVIRAGSDASRQDLRQLALDAARGEILATLDASCRPDEGWLDTVRGWAHRHEFAIGGSFRPDASSIPRRAYHCAYRWPWRPERDPAWLLRHPACNAAFRTSVLRGLGGFHDTGATNLRFASLGARPVRFDPAMAVEPGETVDLRVLTRGLFWAGRMRAASVSRYFALRRAHRFALAAACPVRAGSSLARTVLAAVREGSADRQFVLALPLTAMGLGCYWLGRAAGLLHPGSRGGLVPRLEEDLEVLARRGAPPDVKDAAQRPPVSA